MVQHGMRSAVIAVVRTRGRNDAFDPQQTFATVNYRTAKGSFDHLVGGDEQDGRHGLIHVKASWTTALMVVFGSAGAPKEPGGLDRTSNKAPV